MAILFYSASIICLCVRALICLWTGALVTLLFVFWSMFTLTNFRAVSIYLTGCTISEPLIFSIDATVRAMLLGHFSVTGYSLSRGGNPVSFKGPTLSCLAPLTLQPARKCSLLPHL